MKKNVITILLAMLSTLSQAEIINKNMEVSGNMNRACILKGPNTIDFGSISSLNNKNLHDYITSSQFFDVICSKDLAYNLGLKTEQSQHFVNAPSLISKYPQIYSSPSYWYATMKGLKSNNSDNIFLYMKLNNIHIFNGSSLENVNNIRLPYVGSGKQQQHTLKAYIYNQGYLATQDIYQVTLKIIVDY